jgi:LuxR family maltose regulon positive regulatory protein
MSNREIGEALFITVGTVKWHAHHIYTKLDVKNRGQAVAKARELQLIANSTS